jgi:hypothetical protein
VSKPWSTSPRQRLTNTGCSVLCFVLSFLQVFQLGSGNYKILLSNIKQELLLLGTRKDTPPQKKKIKGQCWRSFPDVIGPMSLKLVAFCLSGWSLSLRESYVIGSSTSQCLGPTAGAACGCSFLDTEEGQVPATHPTWQLPSGVAGFHLLSVCNYCSRPSWGASDSVSVGAMLQVDMCSFSPRPLSHPLSISPTPFSFLLSNLNISYIVFGFLNAKFPDHFSSLRSHLFWYFYQEQTLSSLCFYLKPK